ncbi:hypothetical protein AL755_02065 (plasmid) [Arthrobacter sp. ERGS1:01]|nr:hypothetical protein AL755_02065 [Arthrobacter sp. ERGS1:01]
MARRLPVACAILAFTGIVLLQFDPTDQPGHWWVPGFTASIIFALATPVAFTVLVAGRVQKPNRDMRWLIAITALLAVLSVAASSQMLSYGSRYGASGDIGGTAMWLLSTVGLLAVALVTTTYLPKSSPPSEPQQESPDGPQSP